MSEIKKKTSILLGFTLFGMFFGAGNLIFPPILGNHAGSHFIPAIIGFIATAVILPLIGVYTIIRAGSLDEVAKTISPQFSTILTLLIYLSIGPMLAIPRTSSTSFSIALKPFIGNDFNAIFAFLYSILFFATSFIVALRPKKLTHNIGKITTPALVLLMGTIFIVILSQKGFSFPKTHNDFIKAPLATGFLQGYQTMDALASLVFALVFLYNIQDIGITDNRLIKKYAKRACFIAGILFTLMYTAIALIGRWTSIEGCQNGATLLTKSATKALGTCGMIILATIFVLACFNTCTSLLCCCSNYFSKIFPRFTYKQFLIAFTIFSCIISNAGLDLILKISIPILNAIYPLAILLILYASFQLHKKESFHTANRLALLCAGLVSCSQSILSLFNKEEILSFIPLYEKGLAWVTPSIIGFLIGIFLKKYKK